MLLISFLENNISLILVIIFIWQLLLTFLFFKSSLFYDKLKNGGDLNFDKLLNRLEKKTDISQSEIDDIKKQLAAMEVKANNYFAKYALLRFNPFEESGGSQSFVIALLSKNDDGFIISSLHTRDRTRTYAKPINSGKSTEYELSTEEEKTLKKAIAGQKSDF